MTIELAKRKTAMRHTDVDLADRPRLSIRQTERVLVIAPHPDDEVIGAGGLLSCCAALGVEVTVIAVTNGESAFPHKSQRQRRELAIRRTGERDHALDVLGLKRSVVSLNIPDGLVADFEDEIGRFLLKYLHRSEGEHDSSSTIMLFPWEGDLHPDHVATGQAARRVGEAYGCRTLAMPIWSWYHRDELGSPLPLDHSVIFPLTVERLETKMRALRAFSSQFDISAPGADPILPADFLSEFSRPFEVFFK